MSNQYPLSQPTLYSQDLSATKFIPTPTAWQSIPSPVRFAAWVWAISVIASVIGAALFLGLFYLGVIAALS